MSRPPHILAAGVLALVGLLVGGCRWIEPHHTTAGPYRGPTLTLLELVDQVNGNNQQLTSLWARGLTAEDGGFEARLRERLEDPLQFVNGDIGLLYLPDNSVRLRGEKPGLGLIFDVGSNDERFWLHMPTERLIYIGSYDGLHPEAARELPIRPDLLVQVLGVIPLPSDLLLWPAPALRFNPDHDAYMLTYSAPITDDPPPRLGIVREVWYDRQTLLPTLVVLFDRDGRPVLRAYLSRHQEVQGAPGAAMATHFDLYFPDTGSTMQIRLSELRLTQRGGPRPANFVAPDPRDVRHVVDLDRPPARQERPED